MPPRKRANPSSSSSAAAAAAAKNQNQNQNQASQPSKYGIQRFFERHSQHAVPASQDPPEPRPAAAPSSKAGLDLGKIDRRKPSGDRGRARKSLRDLDANAADSNLLGGSRAPSSDIAPAESGFENANENRVVEASERLANGVVSNCVSRSTPSDNLLRTGGHGEGTVSPVVVSPEMMKSTSVKRFKFSPGMLIKQSQDDGGDEITWKISPVNERLQTVSKHMPETIKVLAESSRLNSSYIQQCSRIKSTQEAAGTGGMCLSSPFKKASGRPCCANSLVGKEVNPDKNMDHEGKSSEVITTQVASQQSPFQTPPSLSYCQDKPANGTACNGVLNELGLRQHKKALLELLDQVEDAISIDEPLPNVLKGCSSKVRNGKSCELPVKVRCDARVVVPQKADMASLDDIFLVLEVAENSGSADSGCGQSPYKVLRLLNEQNGEERTIHLWDEWFYSVISPGDTVNVIGQFGVQGKCDVSRDSNFVIVHPDLLASGTRVAASFTCPRRTVLDERLKSSEYSTAALIGTLLHQIFQAGLVKEEPTKEFLDECAGVVLQKNVESLYACGVSEKDILNTLIEANPRLLNWIILFKNSQFQKAPTVDFGSDDGLKKVNISEVIDIEEMSWAPKYGLKGMIDASVRVIVESNTSGVVEKIVPLEFKSGKGPNGQSSMEHRAQVILYTLLMSERYLKPIDSGLLYYLQSDHTHGITVRRSDLVGLIMRRNELATYILEALTTQQLPPMLQSPSICKGCRHIDVCTLYHKAHGGSTENSGLGDLFNAYTNHLTTAHSDFLRHWDRLIDLEAREAEHRKKELWRSRNSRRDESACSLSSLVLDTSDKVTSCTPSRDNRFTYQFVGQTLTSEQVERFVGNTPSAGDSTTTGFACKLSRGDIVILSTESGQRAIASGVISEISRFHVSVSFSKRLRLPGSSPLSEVQDLVNEVWRIDKDEIITSFAVMRFNLVQLFRQDARSSHLRKMIVDLEPPRFDSGCIFSQDPAISYVWSEEKLNDDQRRAIVKILTAKDYTLILGMPGTGKTSTMVHAVKALLMRGASILLTSYTNSAVDNLLIKLKDQGIDFVRIGRPEVVHEEVREHCFPEKGMQSVDGIKLRLDQVKVVAVTCLGITSPLLASKRFDVCIMDEAGQTTLPVSLGPLMFASVFVLVGDHYQLPPLVQSTEARENGLGISLFCRLSEAHPQAISALQSQYRMCQGIMQLSNALIYGDRLRCGSSDVANAKLNFAKEKLYSSWLKEVLEPGTPVVFLNTDLLPAFEEKYHKTLRNPTEACIIGKITEELVESGIKEEDIGIITPYNSQADLIRNAVCGTSVEIHTIDKYQGRDKDCIIVSFVRSNKEGNHCNSSLLGDWHRINVALTRAKKKLIMVGSLGTLSKLPLLKLLIENVDKQSGILSMSKEDFSRTECLKRCSHTERN
ncbi:DNA replication ATP-dependent helicase/nuclease JHS1 [Syzygium oleosum]|uniref:DNA replication ATP-dependent helicase/nuclease JHS1 n=1 Tax=Syzygium oleosum TaxID=219896 RepID=UPI0024BA7B00|nr:DNA replication ATP-dependent helicase/nuclease JHS1 [Syzygium oleosum]